MGLGGGELGTSPEPGDHHQVGSGDLSQLQDCFVEQGLGAGVAGGKTWWGAEGLHLLLSEMSRVAAPRCVNAFTGRKNRDRKSL